MVNAGNNASISINIPAGTTLTNFTVVVIGTNGPVTHVDTVKFTIQAVNEEERSAFHNEDRDKPELQHQGRYFGDPGFIDYLLSTENVGIDINYLLGSISYIAVESYRDKDRRLISDYF
ncbi:MAG: hypothetical protein AB1489_20960 [Acidobacteriota bacterium]